MHTCRFPVFCFPVLRIRGRGLLVRKASVRLFSQLSPCHINHLFPWVVSYSSTSSCCHQTSAVSLTCHSGHWESDGGGKAWMSLNNKIGCSPRLPGTGIETYSLSLREVWGPLRKGRWLLSWVWRWEKCGVPWEKGDDSWVWRGPPCGSCSLQENSILLRAHCCFVPYFSAWSHSCPW